MTKARIILISDNTPSGPVGFTRYVGPYVLATQLENAGFDCVIVDYFTRSENFLKNLKEILTPQTVALAISTTFLSPEKSTNSFITKSMDVDYFAPNLCFDSDDQAFDWFSKAKKIMTENNPDSKIIIGGAKTTHLFNHAKAGFLPNWTNLVDYFVLGAADLAIVEITKAIVNHEEEKLPLIAKFPAKFISAGASFPVSEVPTTHFQHTHAIQPNEWLPIELKRGCAFACKFCHFDKNVSTYKGVTRVQNEMIRNYESFGVTGYHFCDDCYNDNYDKVMAFSKMFSELPFKLEWVSYARIDMFWRYPETIDHVLDSGCRGLFLGIETLHQPAGIRAGKGLSPDKVIQTLHKIKEKANGRCALLGSFIIGLPGETISSLQSTLDWILKEQVFDGVQYGVLALAPKINVEIDKSVVDFSAFSRNPEKYGFKTLTEETAYWEHDTMNYNQAVAAHDHWRAQLKDVPGTSNNMRTVFCYPRLRSLGFSHEQAMQIQRNPNNNNLDSINDSWYKKYHAQILNLHQQKNQNISLEI